MNKDEIRTEQLIEQSKQTILQKYNIPDPKTSAFPSIPHAKFVLWIAIFLFSMLMFQLALPVPETPVYPENIFNSLFFLSSFAWLLYIPLVFGYELGKKK